MHRVSDLKVTGSESLLNRAVTVVEGTPDAVHLESFGDHFKIWVDNETGILLKSEFSIDGKAIETQTVTELELDHPINDAEFEFPAVNGFKNVGPDNG